MQSDSRIIVALDFANADLARRFVVRVSPRECRLKVGKELFTRAGPELVREFVAKGFDVFLDLKFHDIPNTVAQACSAAADLGVWMVNVHALGGEKMMNAAREALRNRECAPKLLAVTVLTSMDEEQLRGVGLAGSAESNVLRLARLAKDSGMDGVVCSPRELSALRREVGQDFLLVTPGVRPRGSAQDDQKRVMTPAEAVQNGASYLVVGRPITGASDPRAALAAIAQEIVQTKT